MTKRVVVFGDGETWSLADDVVICDVSDAAYTRLEAGEAPKHVELTGMLISRAMAALTKLESLAAVRFGKEAEELRAGIEALRTEDHNAAYDLRRDLQVLLDTVDARDSLFYCEHVVDKKGKEPAPSWVFNPADRSAKAREPIRLDFVAYLESTLRGPLGELLVKTRVLTTGGEPLVPKWLQEELEAAYLAGKRSKP